MDPFIFTFNFIMSLVQILKGHGEKFKRATSIRVFIYGLIFVFHP